MQIKLTARMGVQNIREVFSNMLQLGVRQVNVGVVGERAREPAGSERITNATNALYQEFGTRDGHVPERRFMRGSVEAHRDDVARMLREMVVRAVVSGLSKETGLREVTSDSAPLAAVSASGTRAESGAKHFGGEVSELMRNYILNSEVRPLDAESTRKKKGPLPALVDTMSLVDAISFQVVRADKGVIEGPVAFPDAESAGAEGGTE